MATTNKLFTLASGNTGNLSVSTTSATVSIASLKSGSEDAIRLCCDVAVDVRLTNGAGTALTTDLYLPANSAEAFSIPADATHLSAITPTGTGTLSYAVSKGA